MAIPGVSHLFVDTNILVFATDSASPFQSAAESALEEWRYIDNRPLLVATKPELREYKAVYVQSDAEIGLFSDEVVVNCAP